MRSSVFAMEVSRSSTSNERLHGDDEGQRFKLDGLHKLVRGDGITYYCFSEVKVKLFSEIPMGTIKSWIRHFKISKSKCSATEHSYFKRIIPDIAVGAFKLIREEDVLRLLLYSQSREAGQSSPKKRQKVQSEELESFGGTPKLGREAKISKPRSLQYVQESECDKVSQSVGVVHKEATPTSIAITSTNIRNTAADLDVLENSCTDVSKWAENAKANTSICSYSSSSSSSSSSSGGGGDGGSSSNPNNSSDESDSHHQDLQTVVTSSGRRRFKFRQRSSRKLRLEEIDSETSKEIENLKSFYSRPLNTQRNGHALQPATIEKMVEKILVYFKYLKTVKGFARPLLKHIEDGTLVEEFCGYLLSNDRKLKSVTVSRHVGAFVNVFRYLHRGESASNRESRPSLSKLRALQSQLEFDARREKKSSSGQKKSIHYEEILQLARELLHEFEDATVSMLKARALMDFCILLFYTHVTGRCKEFVTLRIIDSEHSAHSLEGNFLIAEPESITLLCSQYKTCRFYGSDKTVLKESRLQYYIRLYLDGYRAKLLQGNSHDYFFVNHHGNPFSAASFNKYVGTLFEKHCNFRFGINDIRHSLVTFFLTMPESGDKQMSESMATVMKHSMRSQRQYYDERSTEVKKAPALNFLARTARNAIFDDDDAMVNESEVKADDEGYSAVEPLPGDIVALVAGNSSNSSPQILIARILRYSKDRKDVLLAHLEEVAENLFQFVLGKSYLESPASLIFPIDVVYRASDRVYELRSDKLDLHKQVHQ